MTADLTLAARGPADRRSRAHGRRTYAFTSFTGSVTLTELRYLSQVDLRVDPAGSAAARIEAVLGHPLPGPNRVAGDPGERAAPWLGPDEWLVVAPDGAGAELITQLDEALAGDRGCVVDVSANRTTIVVSGPSARDLLEKGCTLDLHPRSFTAGHCAQTTFARGQLILWQTAPEQSPSGPEYRLLLRPSFADYFAAWLLDAAEEFAMA